MKTSEIGLSLEERWLCLHLANTLRQRLSPEPIETLLDYSDLLNWSEGLGLLKPVEVGLLAREATLHSNEAELVLRQAVQLREALVEVLRSYIGHNVISGNSMAIMNSELKRSAERVELYSARDGFDWAWSEDRPRLEQLLWPLARSAGALLTSTDLESVGMCADDRGCGFLFFDGTRNKTRQWCSMESCGNRAKASRHYLRQKTAV